MTNTISGDTHDDRVQRPTNESERDDIFVLAQPRLPRTFVPRRRFWERLDRATQDAVTVVVAPAGAGKTLAVSGWLRESAQFGPSAVWVEANGTWNADRLAALLDHSVPTAEQPVRLVVIDDAHLLPAAAVRLIDDRLDRTPQELRLVLLSRWDLPLRRMVPQLLGHYTRLRGDVLRL